MKILFVVPYPPGEAPSQRFRFEQYFDSLTRHGYTYAMASFLSPRDWKILYEKGHLFSKTWLPVKGFIKRCLLLFSIPTYDFIFLHREAAPVGPPVFEWIVAKVFRKKIIYDFDDAIWLTDREQESFFFRIAKWRGKVAAICRWSYAVSCGNEYLCRYAQQFNKRVVYNPTTIDTETLHNRKLYPTLKKAGEVVIGWTGSHSTLKYLQLVEHELAALEKKYPQLVFLLIADKRPELAVKNTRFIPWSFQTEIAALTQADIGIMPLPDDEWAKGKCGFKALQYMALQIPAVVSPVGVNTTIIEHGINGLLCATPADWITGIEKLIADNGWREQLGARGREKVVAQYSVNSNEQNFLSLFR